MKVRTCGIDLAKNVFAIHGVDVHGRACLRKQLRRRDMAVFFARMEPCLTGMEACASAHYWVRKLTELGHTVNLMAPQFVKPYVKTNKNACTVIPPRSNRRNPRDFDRIQYRSRNLIERFFNRLKNFRRVATRYDKLADNFLVFVQLACAFARKP